MVLSVVPVPVTSALSAYGTVSRVRLLRRRVGKGRAPLSCFEAGGQQWCAVEVGLGVVQGYGSVGRGAGGGGMGRGGRGVLHGSRRGRTLRSSYDHMAVRQRGLWADRLKARVCGAVLRVPCQAYAFQWQRKAAAVR